MAKSSLHDGRLENGNREHLLDILERRASDTPDIIAYTFLKDGQDIDGTYTYAQLDLHARSIAKRFGSNAQNERALLIYPPGVEFMAGFYGSMYSGAIPIPAPPPDPTRLKRTLPRLKSIIDDARAKYILTTRAMMDAMTGVDAEALQELSELEWIITDEVPAEEGIGWEISHRKEYNDIAYLQYTSGSTSTPKGVMVTYGNVVHNCEHITTGFGYDSNCVMVTWMPYFHDYGLIDGLTAPLFHGFPCYILSPLTFIRRPERWLQAIHTFRGTHTQAPNFAYELCVSKIDDKILGGLDLSSMITFSSGGEHIRVDTVKAFTKKFAACGLKPEAVCPAYGLAEGTLVVSAKTPSGTACFLDIDSDAYKNDLIKPVESNHEKAWSLVSSGRVFGSYQVAIVDPNTLERVPDGKVGEVWAHGGSVCAGYWLRPDESEQNFRAKIVGEDPNVTYLRTGDLGFLHGDQLFITGRAKDLIIIAGANHYPQDIELTVQNADPAIRTDHCAAFSVEVDGEERLVIIAEAEKKNDDWSTVLNSIQRAVSETHELELFALQIIKRGNIFKTSSGKLQRRLCKVTFLNNEFDPIYSWVRPVIKNTASSEISNNNSITDKNYSAIVHKKLLNAIKSIVSAELSVPIADLVDSRPLAEYGMSSRAAVSIAAGLESLVNGAELPATFLWEYPTIKSIADFILSFGSQPSVDVTETKESNEDIAIIGMACRFPGADNIADFWHNLRNGLDSISTVPNNRWNADDFYNPEAGKPGFINNKLGGFLSDIDTFDAAFFGISPTEAETMDPQQRLLLECSWHSFEDAGITLHELNGSRTGVFVGISTNDYQELQLSNRFQLNPYTGPGKAYSIAANRLSYFYNLTGPSLAIDTACSSSLVAVHQAVQSLRRGECNMAIAGGVNAIITPTTSIALSQAQMLSPDGHCKTFDARANGYVRSEGVGVVVLKKISDALKDGDHIHAIIKGSAINQDGRSNGLTAPNANAQKEVITNALTNSGLSPSMVEYIEAHGTGTALGDPIETSCLMQVYGQNRAQDQLCYWGSVKTNIGHLEAAAGIAGLIKSSLAISNGVIPPIYGFETLNEKIKIENTPFRITTELVEWSSHDRYAGVSSFGFGGTNAHVILGSPPTRENVATESHTVKQFLLPISASSASSIHRMASHYRHIMQNLDHDASLQLCTQAKYRRSSLSLRSYVTGSSVDELVEKLNTEIPVYASEKRSIVWMFTGQGSQYTGMAEELYKEYPVFRSHLDKSNEILSKYWTDSLYDILWNDEVSDKLNETRYTQAAVFAVQMAIVELLKSFGLRPDLVAGYSVGEFSAACCAGIFSVDEGLQILAERGRMVSDFGLPGGMTAIQFSENESKELLSQFPEIEIATINGEAGTVLAGPLKALDNFEVYCSSKGIDTRRLNVSHAFHTSLMDGVLEPFRELLAGVEFKSAVIPVISNLTGTYDNGAMCTSDYWVRHLREPVRFGDSIQTIFDEGIEVFLEIGPKPVLSGMASRFENGSNKHWLPIMRQGMSDVLILTECIGMLWALGVIDHWEKQSKALTKITHELPLYSFEDTSYWLRTHDIPSIKDAEKYPLTGNFIESDLIQGSLFSVEVSTMKHPYYQGHKVFGTVVVPAAGHLAMLLEAVSRMWKNKSCVVENMLFIQPLVLQPSETSKVRLLIKNTGEFTLADESSAGKTLAMGSVSSSEKKPDPIDFKIIQSRFVDGFHSNFYKDEWQENIQLGDEFRQITSYSKTDTEVLVSLNSIVNNHDNIDVLHPGFVDSTLQGLTVIADVESDEVLIPFSFNQVSFYGKSKNSASYSSLLKLISTDSEKSVADVTVFEHVSDGSTRILFEIKEFTARRVKSEILLKDLKSVSSFPSFSLETIKIDHVDASALMGGLQKIVFSESNAEAVNDSATFGVLVKNISTDDLVTGTSTLSKLAVDLIETAKFCQEQGKKLLVITSSDPIVSNGSGDLIPISESIRALVRQIEKEILPGNCLSLSVPFNTLFKKSTIDSRNGHEGYFISFRTPIELSSLFDINHTDLLVRNEALYAPILNEIRVASSRSNPTISSSGRYIITGANGSLANSLVEWLINNGAGEIDLVSRNISQHFIEKFSKGEDEVTSKLYVVPGNVTDSDFIQSLVNDPDKFPVRGVFHLAGTLHDGLLKDLTMEDFDSVLLPKITGLINLHNATRDKALDYFVAYSSASSVLSTPGQGNYAMANAFIDAFMEERNQSGLSGLSISWGPFETGMATGLKDHFEHQGIRLLDAKYAEYMGHILSIQDLFHVLVMDVDWNKYSSFHGNPALLSKLSNVLTDRITVTTRLDKTDRYSHLSGQELKNILESEIRNQIAIFLHKADPMSVPARKRLFEIGLDSLGAVELKNRLSSALGKDLRSTLLFDYPTIEDLTDHISGLYADGSKVHIASSDTNPTHILKSRKSELSGDQINGSNSYGFEDDINDISDMSESELEALLRKELGED